MSDLTESPQRSSRRDRAAFLLALTGLLLLATYFRIEQIGLRSLWRDELCTWHASRMPLGESLRWGPELTKPPAYQLALRAVTQDPHPSESMLRLPAVLCGLALLPVAVWMGRLAGGFGIGLALLALLAVNALQVFYSREARPYSMLVLGCAISTGLWYSLITNRRTGTLCAYVAVTALTLYAHYLAGLTIVGHAVWWLVSHAPSRGLQPSRTPRRLKPAAQCAANPRRQQVRRPRECGASARRRGDIERYRRTGNVAPSDTQPAGTGTSPSITPLAAVLSEDRRHPPQPARTSERPSRPRPHARRKTGSYRRWEMGSTSA